MVRSPDAAGQVRNVETMADSHDSHDTHDTHEIKGNRDLREIPVKMLRGLFSGIGELLLAADRFRAEDAQREGINHDGLIGPPTGLDGEPAAQQMKTVDHVKSAADSGETATSARGRHRKPAGATTAGRSGSAKKHASNARKFRSLDATGNVRLLTPEMPAESTSRTTTPSNAAFSRGRSTGVSRKTRKVAARGSTPSAGHKATVAPDLPVSGYDELSLASIRARLRYLDAKQLRILLEHEKSALNRTDVVSMFERRIAKIESGPDAT